MSRYSTFKYGDGTKYGEVLVNLNLWGVEIDWDDDGVFDGANDGVNAIGMKIERGRDNYLRLGERGEAVGFERLRPGSATVTLDNTDDRYDPNNTTSPLYPNVEPGRAIRISVRPANSADVKVLFTGTVSDINVFEDGRTGNRAVITCIDGMQDISDNDARSLILVDKRVDELIHECLDDAGWPVGKRRISQSWITVPFWWSNQRAYSAIYELVDVDGGSFFIDKDGNATFCSLYDEQTAVIALDQTEVLKYLPLSSPWEIVRNKIDISANPITQQTIGELWRLSEIPGIAPGESVTYWATYQYSGDFVPAYPVTAPVATTDYLANEDPGGLDTNYTANISVAFTDFGETAKIVVTNNAPKTAFITLLKVRGQALTKPNRTRFQFEIGAANRLFTINSPWLQGLRQAQDARDYYSLTLPDASPFPTVTISNRPAKQFSVDLFDLIALDVAEKNIDSNFMVAKISHEWHSRNGQDVVTRLHLERSKLPRDHMTPIAVEIAPDTSGDTLFWRDIEQPPILDAGNFTLTARVFLNSAADTTVGAGGLLIGGYNNYESPTSLAAGGASARAFITAMYQTGQWRLSVGFQSDGGGSAQAVSDTALPTGAWASVVGVHTGAGNFVTYINGASTGTTGIVVALIDAAATGFLIGNVPGAGFTFDGKIQDVRSYSRVLSAAEALAYHNGTAVDDTGLYFEGPFAPTARLAKYTNFPLVEANPVYEARYTSTASILGAPIGRPFYTA